MFLQPKQSLSLSLCSIKRCIGFSKSRDFHLTKSAFLRKVSTGRRKTADVFNYKNNSCVAGEFSVSEQSKNVNDDFFGIESGKGVIEINSKPSLNSNAARQLFKNVEQEKFITTTYGTVRYDSENKPKYHGQLEKEKTLISSNVEKDKILNLNQTLASENSAQNHSVLFSTEKSSKTVIDTLDRNLKSKLPSSSYVDESYFPEAYADNENDTVSKLENSSSSRKENKTNFIEEFYFSDKNTTEPIFTDANITSETMYSTDENLPVNKSTEYVADHNLSSFQTMSELQKLPSSSANDESNFIEDYYFNDEIADESVNRNMDVTSENIINTDKNHHTLCHNKPAKCIADNEQSSFFDGNLENVEKKNFKSVTKIVDTVKKNSDKKHSANQPRVKNNETLENNLFINESEAASKFSLLNEKFRKKNFISQETEKNMKSLYDLNESIENINTDNNGTQLSSEFNNPSLEELEDYNKFLIDATQLSKKKNNFLFQSAEFLKKSALIDSKTSSRVKKLKSFQKNVNEIDKDEENQNKVGGVESSQETLDIKVQKEANIKNANDQSDSAYDFVKKLRSPKKLDPELINGMFIQKTEQYDSKGFRILKNQVPNLNYYTRDEILDLLVKNVLYSDDDLIVLNKPYNLVMHESKTAKDPCLSQYLDDLAVKLDTKTYKPKLITVHRLDKETSGCLLLARNEISAQRLLSFFSERKIIKTYWIVTVKVPEPLEGVIDIPISEGSINGLSRMVLHPTLPKDVPYKNHSKSGKRAVTHYKVIAESGNAALVEAKPETGIKHQIRVHFGFGLSCPILGDHKYSHLDKLVPQKLQSDILQRLHVRQSKVRHIPMHIYARSIYIPQYREGRNLFVMAPMPIYMSKNLQRLKFRK